MHNRMAQPKVSDSEMQYYQFKARQMFLLQKEDYEWQQFCSRKISKCSTCKSECSSSSKDVGSQTVMRTSFIVGKKPPSESKLPPAQSHVDLNFIKSKLDRIDEMLSELKFSENDEQLEKTRLIASSSNLIDSKVSAMESLDG
ncbi:uncharacterized protein LOC129226780 [Uloborus diversus]|uniref:uncharacterized protein LOC129226780 n=1 Tax=Uloborus diversus TaxID=327109 RepID=UPI00240990F5|nr:uncharacterized protein LOC129226780 [Uloborus diversus]